MSEPRSRPLAVNYGENYARLVQIKSRYDPGNLFQMNQNIEPLP